MTQEAYGVERGHPCSMPKACYEWTALSKALLQPGQRNPGSDHTPWLEAHWQKYVNLGFDHDSSVPCVLLFHTLCCFVVLLNLRFL